MPASRRPTTDGLPRVLVIACGALGRELVDVIRATGLTNVDVTCLPAGLHNRPSEIPRAVARRLTARRDRAGGAGPYARVFVAYADCGTGGMLDRVLEAEGIERLPGAHCYEVYAGAAAFARLSAEEPGTFYLTDFLARNFERLVVSGLGLDRHPELLGTYFGNYRRLVYLSQADDPALVHAAQRAAARLGLAFEHRPTGHGELRTSILAAAGSPVRAGAAGVAIAAAGGPVGGADPLTAAGAAGTRVATGAGGAA